MALVVGTDTYITESELTAYATARGITILADKETLLIKAMDYIEIQSYWGSKTDEDQELEFPRNGDTAVPEKIKTAQIVTALLIDSGEDMFPTSEQAVKREKIDLIEIEYQDYTNSLKSYPQLDKLLAPFLSSSGGSFMVSRV